MTKPFALSAIISLLASFAVPLCITAADGPPPEYSNVIAPLFAKYCNGCHNADDREGKLSLESFAELQKGGEHGVAVLPGDSESSRLIRVLTGKAEPKMPPEDEKQPTEDEIAVLIAWVNAGATGPEGQEPDRTVLRVPKIAAAANGVKPITALAWAPGGELVAVARFGEIELLDGELKDTGRRLSGLPGKISSLEFSRDGSKLVAASGVAGLYGKATIWNAADGSVVREITGHRDTLYEATLSPDGTLLATAGYDKAIILWSIADGKPLRTLQGHNGAIYDIAFSPDGTVLASASADETVKIWRVETGERLDTLSQPTDEQLTVAFSPDGRFVVAGGADNRIRVWRLVSKTAAKINPLLVARFGHEGAIVQLAFSADGKQLVSVAEDRTVKLWETRGYTETRAYEPQPDIAAALAVSPKDSRFAIGRMDGSLQTYPLVPEAGAANTVAPVPVAPVPMPISEMPPAAAAEAEPNDAPAAAAKIEVPARIAGAIASPSDTDLFRFAAKAGEQWMVEIKAARDKSPLDSRVEVLSSDGQPIVRTLLQAVRDSYFTFRGKDSDTSDDFRCFNWQEMELNEYLYANGEVVKLWLYPRGPDSGFKVYPGEGKRYTFFDTTANSHALGEPCYIVQPLPSGTTPVANGLPVFPLYFENDDDSQRRWGADSRLTFTAPADGEYFVRVTDTRGFGGNDFRYELTVRPRRPDFKLTLEKTNPAVPAGSGKEFIVRAERLDDFDGEIVIDVASLPPGFSATSPLVIEAGQDVAYGVINAALDAPPLTADNAKLATVTARADIPGGIVTKDPISLGEIKLAEPPKLMLTITAADGSGESSAGNPQKPLELTIEPGQTITAKVRIERRGADGPISFGNAESGRNLPHGIFVDNIGLNGLLIVPGQLEREFFITAAPWVPDQTRTFHLRTVGEGDLATWPVILHVRKKKD